MVVILPILRYANCTLVGVGRLLELQALNKDCEEKFEMLRQETERMARTSFLQQITSYHRLLKNSQVGKAKILAYTCTFKCKAS